LLERAGFYPALFSWVFTGLTNEKIDKSHRVKDIEKKE
jgi:hypothetical protein